MSAPASWTTDLRDECNRLKREVKEVHYQLNLVERGLTSALTREKENATALVWCASWLDTLSDHLQGKGLAWEMLGELSRKRREHPALDEAFASIGWTREAESNFFKMRLIPEEGEE